MQPSPVPQSLPPEVLSLLKKPRANVQTVVEVPLTQVALRPDMLAPTPAPVRPAVGTTAPAQSPAKRPDGLDLASGPTLHGSLAPGQTIVYVLDKSGSMGAGGKFDVARRSLIATLKAQPPTVRLQVVVYDSSASPPLPAPGSGLAAATAEHVGHLSEVIRGLEPPRGRSDHIAGLREALALKPDFVLILTDGDDLPVATFRTMIRRAEKPVALCIARVTADGVGAPVVFK
jgi:hypothetical protein